MLGYALESIRQYLMREAILLEELGIHDQPGPDCVPLEFQPENNVPENNVPEIKDTHVYLPLSSPASLSLSNVPEEGSMNMNKEVVSTPLASPETTSFTPPLIYSEPTSLSPPSSCTNLADPLDSQSKEDDVNTIKRISEIQTKKECGHYDTRNNYSGIR